MIGDTSMGEKIVEKTEDSLALIRNKVKEDVVKSDFRRKLIGGISEDDVEDYINMIQLQFQYKENKLKEQIDELISLKDKLRVEFNTYIEKAEEEKKKLLKELEDAKQSLELLKEQYQTFYARNSESQEKYKTELEQLDAERNQYKLKLDEISKELADVRSKSEVKSSMILELETKLKRKEEAVYENEKLRADLTEQLKIEQISKAKILDENNQLSSRTMDNNKEMNDLYRELENVKEQIKINQELQKQLEQERSRSERVEKEMTDFFKRVISLKNDSNEA